MKSSSGNSLNNTPMYRILWWHFLFSITWVYLNRVLSNTKVNTHLGIKR